MADVELRHSTAADRKLKPAPLPSGHLGSTSDEEELFVGSSASMFGVPVASPAVPRQGVDVRRLFQVGSMGQQDTFTLSTAATTDASGITISPRPHASPNTDIVTTGYVLPYELADGGSMVIEAVGTYKLGSILPRILAKLKIGSSYVAPQYEAHMNATGNTATPTDVVGTIADCFEWSSITMGLNALGGYEALNVAASNLTRGEFHWRLTMKVHALGRWAKWSRGNEDAAQWLTATAYTAGNFVRNSAGRTWVCASNHTSGASTEPGVGASYTTVWADASANCWVEATLEWGALQYNAGARIGEPFAYYNPQGQRTLQYNAFVQRDTGTPANGTVRGAIYSFMGSQWLCHAASDTSALVTGSPNTLDESVWSQMLAEEAPGIGAHWREFFVPAVSKATISGFATVDWTAGNEIQLELGGPQQVDLGTSFAAYGATTTYTAESAGITPAVPDGTVWSPKSTLYVATFPRMIGGTATALYTAAPGDARAWRQLATTLRDEMRMQTVQGYLFGRRNGVAERRLG